MCVTQLVLQISNTGTVQNHQHISDKRHAICKQNYGKVGIKQITNFILIDLYSMQLPRFFDKKKKVGGKRTSQIHATTIYSYVTKLKFQL